MTGALIGGAAAAYASALWLLAARIARRRALTLGSFPAVTVAACVAAAWAVCQFAAEPHALPAAATLVGAMICGVVDARTGFIFDALSGTMALVAAVGASAGGFLADGASAAAAVGATLAALYFLTRRRGIGLGDVKLGTAIALGYGVPTALAAIGSAFVLGALYAVGLIACGRATRADAIRFGPFIAGGAAVGLTAGIAGWLP